MGETIDRVRERSVLDIINSRRVFAGWMDVDAERMRPPWGRVPTEFPAGPVTLSGFII